MSEPNSLDRHLPPSAPLDMPYQVLERRRATEAWWLVLVRLISARRASNE